MAGAAAMSDLELKQAFTQFAKTLEDKSLPPGRREALLEGFREVEAEMKKRKLIRK